MKSTDKYSKEEIFSSVSSLDDLLKTAESMYPDLEDLLGEMINYLDDKYSYKLKEDDDGNQFVETGYKKTTISDKARAYLLRMKTHVDDLYGFKQWEFTQFLSTIREAIPDDPRWEMRVNDLAKMLEVYF